MFRNCLVIFMLLSSSLAAQVCVNCGRCLTCGRSDPNYAPAHQVQYVQQGQPEVQFGYSRAMAVPAQQYTPVQVQQVSKTAAPASGVLGVVNQKRRQAGLNPLAADAGLMRVAQNKSNNRANRRIRGHDGSSKGSARVEGVGFAYGGNLEQRFNTCYLYSSGYTKAGAATSYDNRGRAYYTLVLK